MRNRIVLHAPGSTIQLTSTIKANVLQACIMPGELFSIS